MFEAFTDNPYFTIWREIYALYPDAKYILTVREEQRWIDSCVKFFRHRRMRPMREWMFGPHANPASSPQARQAWLDAYRAHNAAVREFFATRGQQYLELDPTREGKWDRLCAFLGAPIPTGRGRTRMPPGPTSRGADVARVKRGLGLELRDPGKRRELIRGRVASSRVRPVAGPVRACRPSCAAAGPTVVRSSR